MAVNVPTRTQKDPLKTKKTLAIRMNNKGLMFFVKLYGDSMKSMKWWRRGEAIHIFKMYQYIGCMDVTALHFVLLFVLNPRLCQFGS